MALTPKQQLFCDEYLVDLNATQAAIRAGYSKKAAASIGEENLRKPEIESAIALAMTKRQERTLVTQDWVMQRLVMITERCMQAEPVLDREGNPTGEYKFNAGGATKSLDLLGRNLGMWKEKQDGKKGYVARIPAAAESTDTWLQEHSPTSA